MAPPPPASASATDENPVAVTTTTTTTTIPPRSTPVATAGPTTTPSNPTSMEATPQISTIAGESAVSGSSTETSLSATPEVDGKVKAADKVVDEDEDYDEEEETEEDDDGDEEDSEDSEDSSGMDNLPPPEIFSIGGGFNFPGGLNGKALNKRGKGKKGGNKKGVVNGVATGKKKDDPNMIQQKLFLAEQKVARLKLQLGETKKEKKLERASKLEYKRLDELYNKNLHDFYLAESTGQSAQKEDKWEEYIFIVRRRFDWQNKYQKTFVDIKSKLLKDVLTEVLDGIVGISLVEEKPTIEPNLLFNYLPELEEYLEREKSSSTPNEGLISHLNLLIDYINNDYTHVKKRLYPLLAHAEISFDLLWALFLPNTLLYTTCPGSGEDRCLKLDWAELKEPMDRPRYFQLDCHYVDYDGKMFGEANATIEVFEFRGVRKIDSLGVYPLAYHQQEEEMRGKLIERGKKFCELKGMHYRMYKGIAFFKRKKGFVKLNVNGRVMVDPTTFRRINPNYRLAPVKELSSAGGSGLRNEDDDDDSDEDGGGVCCGGGDDDDDDDDEDNINSTITAAPVISKRDKLAAKVAKTIRLRRAASRRTYTMDANGNVQLVIGDIVPGMPGGGLGGTPGGQMNAAGKKVAADGHVQGDEDMLPENMTEEDLLLCSPTVLGFSFSDKLYVELAVAHISDIQWNAAAFDSLVLPEAQKEIVRALVESHTSQDQKEDTGFDDVIKGKGKGLVAVLHGRPGVGKTLTAEGISEYLKRPLYVVGAGELGTDARTLELQLSKILDVAHVWNAVLLLDEADVFLERRSVHDLQRNALVSIFLRLLEYFQGILFLTTNRVETFDEAFQSRIHVALRYKDLDKPAKKQIWRTFLGIVARDEVSGEEGGKPREIVSKEELELLARRELNGRQIKNAVRTAQSLARNKGEKLGMKHLKIVLEVTEGFEKDLKGTGQLDSMMSYA